MQIEDIAIDKTLTQEAITFFPSGVKVTSRTLGPLGLVYERNASPVAASHTRQCHPR